MDIPASILAAYQARWGELSFEKQRHFAARARLLSSDTFWDIELNRVLKLTEQLVIEWRAYSAEERKRYGLQASERQYLSKANDEGKRRYLAQFPELKFWSDYLVHLRYLDRYLGYQVNDAVPVQVRDHLKHEIVTGEALRLVPVIAIELSTDLEVMWGESVVQVQEEQFRAVYTQADTRAEQLNWIYGLTHFVIGRARHYREEVSRAYWPVERLIAVFEMVVKDFSMDLSSEVGVCLKLGGASTEVSYNELAEKAAKHFDAERGVMGEGGVTSLAKIEHVNIMTALALGDLTLG